VIGFFQGIKWDDFQGMKTGIMSNAATATNLGLAIKAMKKQVKTFFPTINSPGRVYPQRTNDQRQINAAGRSGGERRQQYRGNNPRVGRGYGRGGRNTGRGNSGRRNQHHQPPDDGIAILREVFHTLTPKQKAAFYKGRENGDQRIIMRSVQSANRHGMRILNNPLLQHLQP
jgi:hypothetical protein